MIFEIVEIKQEEEVYDEPEMSLDILNFHRPKKEKVQVLTPKMDFFEA